MPCRQEGTQPQNLVSIYICKSDNVHQMFLLKQKPPLTANNPFSGVFRVISKFHVPLAVTRFTRSLQVLGPRGHVIGPPGSRGRCLCGHPAPAIHHSLLNCKRQKLRQVAPNGIVSHHSVVNTYIAIDQYKSDIALGWEAPKQPGLRQAKHKGRKKDLIDDIFNYILLQEMCCILIEISNKCVPDGKFENASSLFLCINDLVPSRIRQAKSWTNNDPFHQAWTSQRANCPICIRIVWNCF